MHYVLIDYENVQPDISAMASDYNVDVTVFLGALQRINRHTSETVWLMDTRAEVIKMTTTGPNALDFHLAFHLGQLVMADPVGSFEIISNDKGYDSLIERLQDRGVTIKRTPGVPRKRETGPQRSQTGSAKGQRATQPQKAHQRPANRPQQHPQSPPPGVDPQLWLADRLLGRISALERRMEGLRRRRNPDHITRVRMNETADALREAHDELAAVQQTLHHPSRRSHHRAATSNGQSTQIVSPAAPWPGSHPQRCKHKHPSERHKQVHPVRGRR